jgi:hypothetical protein
MSDWLEITGRADAPDAVAGAQAGPIERSFFRHDGRIVHKWHHYLPVYDRFLAPYGDRAMPVRLLEIGVSSGGSIELWRNYFGPSAIIAGIDTNASCAAFDGQAGMIRIGSQDDAAFLHRVVAEMGGVDIVIDDGSHMAAHQCASFEILYPLLDNGGLYIVEDLHTSYWAEFEGGYGLPGTFISHCKSLIDDMHHWYHDQGELNAASRSSVAAMHIYDSMVILEKAAVQRPLQSKRGAPAPQR